MKHTDLRERNPVQPGTKIRTFRKNVWKIQVNDSSETSVNFYQTNTASHARRQSTVTNFFSHNNNMAPTWSSSQPYRFALNQQALIQ